MINSATAIGPQLTITGTGFSGTSASVVLNGSQIPVVSITPTQIVATINPLPPAGTYRVVVKSGTSAAVAVYVTLSNVVAKVSLPNQTAAIPTTTIYTPTQTGQYRLSVYATVVAFNTQSGGLLAFNLGWTDDSGPQAINSLLVGNTETLSPGQFVQSLGMNNYPGWALGGPVTTFEAIAGQPITFSVTDDIVSGSVTYSLYYTLERL
jgi:hypothetical protein